MIYKAEAQLTTDPLQFITAITAVVIIIAFPLRTNAAAVHASELTRLTACAIVRNTVFIISQIPAALRGTLTLGSLRTCTKIMQI